MARELEGKTIAILATDGFEQVELTAPMDAVKEAGATVHIVSLKSGTIQGYRHMDKGSQFNVDITVDKANAADYDGLILPGGVHNPDALRVNEDAVQFVRDVYEEGIPIAAICHGPWMLVEADIVEGLTLTSWPSLRTDIENAGGDWVDEEVVVDDGLTTSRKPDDLDAFCETLVREFAEHEYEDAA